MSKEVRAGKIGHSEYYYLRDPNGAPITGLTASQVSASYVRTRGSAVPFQLMDLALPGDPWTSNAGQYGFVEVSSTDAPGLYRVDVPDEAIAAGAESVAVMLNYNGRPEYKEIGLIAWNKQVASIPSAVAGQAGGLPTVDGSNHIAGIQGTINTLDELESESLDPIANNLATASSAAVAAHTAAAANNSLLDELTEDDGEGKLRYTAKALEEAPASAGGGGGGGPVIQGAD